jgi:hypothetical protein
LVAGALSLNNYQLDGEYALNELLAPSQQIQLAGYATAGQAGAAATTLAAVTAGAQSTAEGRAADLSLDHDLSALTRHADVTADPGAVATLARTSMVTGHLSVPELDIHTIDDQLVPIQQENWYRQRVIRAHQVRVAGLRGWGRGRRSGSGRGRSGRGGWFPRC